METQKESETLGNWAEAKDYLKQVYLISLINPNDPVLHTENL